MKVFVYVVIGIVSIVVLTHFVSLDVVINSVVTGVFWAAGKVAIAIYNILLFILTLR